MPMQAYKVECQTCGWFNRSTNYPWTRRAGEVHEQLAPLHFVGETKKDGDWVR